MVILCIISPKDFLGRRKYVEISDDVWQIMNKMMRRRRLSGAEINELNDD